MLELEANGIQEHIVQFDNKYVWYFFNFAKVLKCSNFQLGNKYLKPVACHLEIKVEKSWIKV